MPSRAESSSCATLGGSGTIGGATTVNGNLNPGNSPGVLTFQNGLTMASSTITTMEILGLTRSTLYDGIDVTGGTLTYAGALIIDLQTLVSGDFTFNLFDVINPATSTGEFASINLSGLYRASFSGGGSGVWTASTNSGNEAWVFNHSTGDLSFTVIPEPGPALLGSLGMLFLLRRRR
jgi:hypothetical protein